MPGVRDFNELCVERWSMGPVQSMLYRWWLAFGPRPSGIRRDRLLQFLDPSPGERILEVGPGGGYYTVPVAKAIGPTGHLTILDIDQHMLDFTLARLRKHGLQARIDAIRYDVARLPFAGGSFEAAFMVAVLGEVHNRQAAVSELFRVLVPGGRLIVGETTFDPHAVPAEQLRRLAAEVGFIEDEQMGDRLSWLVRLRRPPKDEV